MQVKIINQSKHSLPAYETSSSAGLDVRANLSEPIELKPTILSVVRMCLKAKTPYTIKI